MGTLEDERAALEKEIVILDAERAKKILELQEIEKKGLCLAAQKEANAGLLAESGRRQSEIKIDLGELEDKTAEYLEWVKATEDKYKAHSDALQKKRGGHDDGLDIEGSSRKRHCSDNEVGLAEMSAHSA
mmetsp:Transcript_18151/g.47301  ORF Transcript_18151/g.47301 Transcript_18151/m.47301 type:complete len:130 (-) Transcript_18151:224-613(-)